MRVVVLPHARDVVAAAADHLETRIRERPELALGVATGATPEPLYAELTRRAGSGLDLSHLQIASLDEYVGLARDHPLSYRHYIGNWVLDPWRIDPERVHLPDGASADPDAAAADFAHDIEALGGVDLQIVGIGVNGHIGFNEPGSPIDAPTRVVELTESTRVANSRYFDSLTDVPTRAITQGLGTIMAAREIVLVAVGPAKQAAVQGLLHGPVSSALPASALQRHREVTVILDQAAAG